MMVFQVEGQTHRLSTLKGKEKDVIMAGNNGWEVCLQTDEFCVGWDVKPSLNQSTFQASIVLQ